MGISLQTFLELALNNIKVYNSNGLLLFEGEPNAISGNILDREVADFDCEMGCILTVTVK